MLFGSKSNLNVRSSSKVRVSHHLGAGLLDVSQESVLYTEGVQLNLEDSGLDGAILEDFGEGLEDEVGYSNISCEAGFLAFFHGLVGHLVSDTFLDDHFVFSCGIVSPCRGVSDLGGDVLEGDGEVDDVHINVVKLEVAQGFLEGFHNSIGVMVGLPKLGDDEKIFSLDGSSIKNALNSFSNFLLVSVIGSSVKASVTSLNGIDNSLGADLVG